MSDKPEPFSVMVPNEARKRFFDIGPVPGGEPHFLAQQNFRIPITTKQLKELTGFKSIDYLVRVGVLVPIKKAPRRGMTHLFDESAVDVALRAKRILASKRTIAERILLAQDDDGLSQPGIDCASAHPRVRDRTL